DSPDVRRHDGGHPSRTLGGVRPLHGRATGQPVAGAGAESRAVALSQASAWPQKETAAPAQVQERRACGDRENNRRPSEEKITLEALPLRGKERRGPLLPRVREYATLGC